MKARRQASVEFKGGPYDGQRRTQWVTGSHPGPMGCVTDAHRAKMHGSYQPDRTRTAEPYLLVWKDSPRGNAKPCGCGCGGRL